MTDERHTDRVPKTPQAGAGTARPADPERAAEAIESEGRGAAAANELEGAPAETESEGPGGGIVGQIQSHIQSHFQSVAGPVADAIGSVLDIATQGFSLRQSAVERRLRRLARDPLPNLYELYPEVREASPRELGLRFVPVEDIRGTAVAGAAQRGSDFLPLKPFRGENWEGRWQRIRAANERMEPLPPVDLIKFEGDYWVVDGHNRVAVTLYSNGVGLDAMVTELVPLDGQTSERPTSLLAFLGETGELRAAVQGRRPAMGMRQIEQQSGDEASGLPEPRAGDADEAGAGATAGEAAADEATPGYSAPTRHPGAEQE